ASRRHRGRPREAGASVRIRGGARRLAPRACVARQVSSRAAWVLVAAAAAVRAVPAQAEEACAAITGLPHAAGSAPRAWPAPLDRKVSLRGRELSLRDALD